MASPERVLKIKGAMDLFNDRIDAGEQLAARLLHLRDERSIVLALPRGGVPVGEQVALALKAPLDVLVSTKLGAPGQPELGFGALAEDGALYIDRDTVRLLLLSEPQIDRAVEEARAEIAERVAIYRGGGRLPDLRGRTAILVDDGIATGGTAHAAIQAALRQAPERLVFAAPVAARTTARELEPLVDELVCVETPSDLWAIGAWYVDFHQLSDAEVLAALRKGSGAEIEPAPL